MARPKNVVSKYVGPIDPPTPTYGRALAANRSVKIAVQRAMEYLNVGQYAEARWVMRSLLLDVDVTRRYLENP